MNGTIAERAKTAAGPPVVLVTGTSSGIGMALSRQLRGSDYRVVATARSRSLHKLLDNGLTETERFRVRPLDVTSDHERRAVIREIAQDWGDVEILVNNAGISYRSVVEHMTEEEEREQMAVNFFGPLALIRLVLPGMRRRRSGRIINVSSVSGMMAIPTMSSYSASKFALEAASEALWYEMKPWNVHVTLVQPGFVHSDSFRHVVMTRRAHLSQGDPAEPYHWYYHGLAAFIEKLMNRSLTRPDDIAAAIVRLMADPRPPLRKPATPDARLFDLLRRLLPHRIYHALLFRNMPGVERWGRPAPENGNPEDGNTGSGRDAGRG